MAFPFSIGGEIRLDSPDDLVVELFFRDVQEGLERAQVTSVERAGARLSFAVSAFRPVWTTNLLVSVDRGEIEVITSEPSAVRFDFSCRRLLLFSTLLAMSLGFVPLLSGESRFASGIAVFGWLWLFGMNYVIAADRLKGFVRQHVQTNLRGLRHPA